MIALFAVAVATAAGIVVASDQTLTCPSADQVSQALVARLPQVIGQDGQGVPAPLWLQWRGSSEASEVQLKDASGAVVLSRVLRVQSGAVDCAALAETVVLIVERYLDELQLQRLEAVRSAPRALPVGESGRAGPWAFGVRTMVRSGRGAWLPPGGELWLERFVGMAKPSGRKQWLFSLGGAAGAATSARDHFGTGRFEQLNAWVLLRGGGWWAGGVHKLGVVADIAAAGVRASRPQAPDSRSAWGAEPWLGLGGRYRLGLGERWFAEAGASIYGAVVRHQLVVVELPENERRVVAATPRIFTDFGISAGVQF